MNEALKEPSQAAEVETGDTTGGLIRLRSAPDELEFDCRAGESVLEAALRVGLPIAHACGGNARCSTCRIWLETGATSASPPCDDEATLKERLALGPEIRLACQLRPTSPLSFRRLVLDQSDLAIANQLDRRRPAQAGEVRNVAVLFFDVANFTSIANRLPPYDVMFLLNKFLARASGILEKHGGYFDKAIGDGFVAIFGAHGGEACALRSIAAAMEILAAVDLARPLMKRTYDIEFSARVGLHYGEALIGALGPPGDDRLTVIGEAANIANRVEQANKEAGTSLLISEELYEQVRDDVISPDFIRVGLRGQSQRRSLYEVTGLTPAALQKISDLQERPFSDLPGRQWVRLVAADELRDGEVVIIEQPRIYVALTRRSGRIFAFNNHCPHNRLSFFGDEIPEGSGLPPTPARSPFVGADQIACRFHGSVFDLNSGGITSWCPALARDGTSPGLEILGDLSKNETPLEVFKCREFQGHIWVEL